MKVVAIGGGGFTHGTFPALDQFCLDQLPPGGRKVGFIGMASDDEPLKMQRFKSRFQTITETQVLLDRSMTAGQLKSALADLDMVYVGGGDTEAMVAAWRRLGWDRVLVDAYRAGVTLAGTSAGAVCWFDRFLFHSGEGPMRPLEGLGLIAMGACPHYSSEPARREALHQTVSAGTMPATVAVDDGVAVAFENGVPSALCKADPEAGAYIIRSVENGDTEQIPLALV